MTIANPIYDAVFKYLMEDKRIARTILSALLKENIIEVDMRPHEYSNGQRELLSVFRIDFGATILKSDGSEELILVELQKNWLPSASVSMWVRSIRTRATSLRTVPTGMHCPW